jgi:exodeoxyribonuclease-3
MATRDGSRSSLPSGAQTDDTKFLRAIHEAGYGAIWHGSAHTTAWQSSPRAKRRRSFRRGLPGEPSDNQTRYLEAEAKGLVIASTYLPNGNPVGSPNFDYKLLWFERFIRYAKRLYASGKPVVLAGDLNVIPTDFDIYNPTWSRFDAVMQPGRRTRSCACWLKAGWMPQASTLPAHGHVLGERQRVPPEQKHEARFPVA